MVGREIPRLASSPQDDTGLAGQADGNLGAFGLLVGWAEVGLVARAESVAVGRGPLAVQSVILSGARDLMVGREIPRLASSPQDDTALAGQADGNLGAFGLLVGSAEVGLVARAESVAVGRGPLAVQSVILSGAMYLMVGREIPRLASSPQDDTVLAGQADGNLGAFGLLVGSAEVGLVARAESVAVGRGPLVEREAVVLRPIEQLRVGLHQLVVRA